MDAFTEGKAAFEAGEYERTIALLIPIAESGNAEAQTILGNCYQLGLVVEANPAQAEYWYKQAVAQGYGLASNNLASMHPELAQQHWQQGFEHSPV